MSTKPDSAVACTSIMAQRSSRPGPPRPCSVSERRPNRNNPPRSAMTPKEIAPSPGSPPRAKAAKIRAPRNRQKPGIHQRLRNRLGVGMEHVLHGHPEVPRERHRQRQRRRVALLLDRVDRLARDVHRLRELLLRELALGAEAADFVAHDVKLACHPLDVKHALHSKRPGGSQRAPTATV